MSDLISRQAAIEAIESHLRVGDEVYPLTRTDKILNHAFEIAASCVYNLPTAERVGKWMAQERGIHTTKYRCSECGRVVWDDTGYDVCIDYPYCNCGARMAEGER